jgi:hypothetical protein
MEQTTWRDGGLQGSERERERLREREKGGGGKGSTRPLKLMLDILEILVIIELSPHNLSPPNSTLYAALPSIRPSAVYIRLFVVSSTPPSLPHDLFPLPPLLASPEFRPLLSNITGGLRLYSLWRETDDGCLIDRMREGHIGSQLGSCFNSLS